MPEPKSIELLYFAIFREARKQAGETVTTHAGTPLELYRELGLESVMAWDGVRLRVAVNDEFADWSTPLANGDNVVFLAPVAGG